MQFYGLGKHAHSSMPRSGIWPTANPERNAGKVVKIVAMAPVNVPVSSVGLLGAVRLVVGLQHCSIHLTH